MEKKVIKDIVNLFVGFFLTALAVVIMVNSNVGLSPWDVLHQGINKTIGVTMGQASIIVGIVVIITSILLGENLGWGTIGSIFVPGFLIDIITNLNILPQATGLLSGVIMTFIGLVVMAIATVAYLKPAMGCGPRDGLMIAIHKKTGKSIGLLRGIMETLAVIIGFLMGGTFGVGTIISALVFGYILEIAFKIFKFNPDVTHKMIFSSLKKVSEK